MGTRGVIAEAHGTGWRGRYHHWDSYPEGLGKTLYELYHGHFKKDLDAMIRVMVHDHPAGWSTINNADWSMPIGYVEIKSDGGFDPNEYNKPKGPQCYCHGSRNEEASGFLLPHEDAGAEWGYVLDPKDKTMTVLRHIWGDSGGGYTGIGGMSAKVPLKWRVVKVINLDKPAPNWKKIQEAPARKSHSVAKKK